MAHVHVREIGIVTNGRGKVNLIFHIPIDNPVVGIVPTPTSLIESEFEAGEISALAAGTVVELSRNIIALETQATVDIVTAIKASWQSVKSTYNASYNFKYKHYGQTIVNATT
ncbi:MAG TPA: hypothetical protein VMW72_16295 [Sedimentisphaerales bacterium]|nr:hypothetical protein [Sedimentisphaerales bacterium]